ncbi:DUF2807 domain-containing protein [Reichenbachiella carrageenanivorans]|uniref:DUF2807 domain-containing protein n=1 Tax=Reichenbachiella carrageenanivorans TaxID=2979869 RepID=A0ABY6CYN1_9BACT|nr:head GIN domain-containing protein [Reichenbachiella carrageenanivorans]UXX78480.1 DUF2807 domain-containing protein [Reichenbachiella carrageenanivorans]
MKKHLICVILALAFNLAQAQNSETRNLGTFDQIRVSQSIKVNLRQGAANEAKIETRGIDVDRVETDIEGSTLYIRMKKGNYSSMDVNIELSYSDELKEISVSSSASISGEDAIATEDFEIRASSSGKANLVLNVRYLEVKISSSAKVELSGKAKYQDLDISSSGKLYAYNMDSENVEANISSSGKAQVTAHRSIEGRASSSGKVYYRGAPEKVDVSANSSGKFVKD